MTGGNGRLKNSIFALNTHTSYPFLCADLSLMPETREDHAAHIASWLKALKNDKKAIFVAASHA